MEKWKRSRFFSISPPHGKIEKGREISVSSPHREMGKRFRNLHLSAAWKKVEKHFFAALVATRKWKKVKKFLVLSSAAKRCIIIITPLATIIRIISPSLSSPSRNHCISELQRIRSGTGIIIKTNYYFYYDLHFHICYGNLR